MPTMTPVNDAHAAALAYRKAAHFKDLPGLRAALSALAVSGLPERTQVATDLALEAKLVADARAILDEGKTRKSPVYQAITAHLVDVRHRIDCVLGVSR